MAITCLVIIDVYFTQLPYWAIVGAYIGVSSLGGIHTPTSPRAMAGRSPLCCSLEASPTSPARSSTISTAPRGFTGWLGAHELFHFLVIVGAALHWSFIFNWAGRRDRIKRTHCI